MPRSLSSSARAISSTLSPGLAVSRLPVGSSASSRRGPIARSLARSRRAAAHRPRAGRGDGRMRSCHSHRVERRVRASPSRSAVRHTREHHRQLDVAHRRRGRGTRWIGLEDEADLVAAHLGRARSRPRGRLTSLAIELVGTPDVGRSRQPMMLRSVDLPEPDGPMMATCSPSRIVSVTPSRARSGMPPTSYTRERFSRPIIVPRRLRFRPVREPRA